jgi:hypothetical protein
VLGDGDIYNEGIRQDNRKSETTKRSYRSVVNEEITSVTICWVKKTSKFGRGGKANRCCRSGQQDCERLGGPPRCMHVLFGSHRGEPDWKRPACGVTKNDVAVAIGPHQPSVASHFSHVEFLTERPANGHNRTSFALCFQSTNLVEQGIPVGVLICGRLIAEICATPRPHYLI